VTLPPLIMLSGIGTYMYIHPIPVSARCTAPVVGFGIISRPVLISRQAGGCHLHSWLLVAVLSASLNPVSSPSANQPPQILQRSAADREVIIFDHMRVGASANDTTSRTAPLTIPLMAKSTADLIKALRVRWARALCALWSQFGCISSANIPKIATRSYARPNPPTNPPTHQPNPTPDTQLPTKPDLYGWSLGGAVVTAMAALQGGSFRHGVIINGWSGGDRSFVMPEITLDSFLAVRNNITKVGGGVGGRGGVLRRCLRFGLRRLRVTTIWRVRRLQVTSCRLVLILTSKPPTLPCLNSAQPTPNPSAHLDPHKPVLGVPLPPRRKG